jgi:hypothetical protein
MRSLFNLVEGDLALDLMASLPFVHVGRKTPAVSIYKASERAVEELSVFDDVKVLGDARVSLYHSVSAAVLAYIKRLVKDSV